MFCLPHIFSISYFFGLFLIWVIQPMLLPAFQSILHRLYMFYTLQYISFWREFSVRILDYDLVFPVSFLSLFLLEKKLKYLVQGPMFLLYYSSQNDDRFLNVFKEAWWNCDISNNNYKMFENQWQMPSLQSNIFILELNIQSISTSFIQISSD